MAYYRARDPRQVAAAAVLAGLALAGASKAHAGSHHHHHGHGHPASTSHAAAAAISYARDQLGKPYCWAGTGPSCYDCSGLTQQAYASAGVSIERTAADQWASLPHAKGPAPGELVFAPGLDGSWASPGHVALVISRGRVIQAFATGTPIEVSSLRSFAATSGGIIGYARPS